MLPVIALVGRPNVGKSTLFNRLTQSRDALVANLPGLTRDRQYGIGKLGPMPYVVVDTGGIGGGQDEGIDSLMYRQARLAVDEADHVLFMTDARDGCMPGDLAIADYLRRLGKPLTLVVNKSDGMDTVAATADFHALGLDAPVPIAASHGRGVKQLMERVLRALPEPESAEGEGPSVAGIKVAVVGRPNVGKSTLINRLLGEERVITFDQPGTTRDSIFIPFERDGRDYTLIDTAGVRRRARISETIEKFSVIKTLQAIEAANVVVLVLDARDGVTEQDASLAGHILESGRALIVAVNKWDGLPPDEREAVKAGLQRKLGFLDFARWRFISALHGSGVGNLPELVDEAYDNAVRDLATPELTRILEQAVFEHQPPLVKGRRVKLRYAHQGGKNPPIIVIHGNQTEALPDAYRRYLINYYRKALDIRGTPIRLELKTGANPFADRRNLLTTRQIHKKERLKKFVKRKK
ncbi:MAG: ribosome biogenesis GTPase Der [Gammaproteobacteria bacterium]|nr:ribosome biogenesis GTPase Der [Gammaproteobacteria bacterium]MBU1655663.1 ribosome biogenesis GTPase Der [Gammaproteobacteria bacterium]MBU1960316.1 ribosome biogenesis GTPase Der [Gammaproteobacteria bacterium]